MRKALTNTPQVALNWIRSVGAPPDELIIPRSFGHGPKCWLFSCSTALGRAAAMRDQAADLRKLADEDWDPGMQIALEQAAIALDNAAKALEQKYAECCR